MKYKSNWKRITAMIAVGLALTASFPFPAAAVERPSYLKAATYVSDAWVMNFWNTESDNMDAELAQIAADGFNGIILVIPWREFQPQFSPIVYNSYAFQKFYKVMQKAQEHGLWVQLRISYTWDYYNLEGSNPRFYDILEDSSTRRAWIQYVSRIYQTASRYQNFCGGFITWEDFWNFVEDAPAFGTGSASVEMAKKIGYQSYLKKNYTLKKINEAYRPKTPFTSFDQVYIPKRESPGFKMFYEFYDDFLTGLLRDAQKVFPDLSMEVRLDVDPVEDGNGGKIGAAHFSTFPCAGSSYTSVMYSVSMGQDFGAVLSSAGALDMMAAKLDEVRAYNGGKPVFIDQLLYMDVTEGFEQNARLADSERVPFLVALPTVLRGRTNGYGIWTYRNYTNNPLYNCQFALGSRCWETSRAKVEERSGSRKMKVEADGWASQQFGGRLQDKENHENRVRFTAESDGPVTLVVSIGREQKTVEVNGQGRFELNFGKLRSSTLTFAAKGGTAYLDNVELYNFVQDGQLYDLDGRELSCIGAIRALNAQMN